MAILSKACKPDNFESHNSLKFSFTNIWSLRLNFVDCESYLGSNSPDILALCETILDDSDDSGDLFVRGYLFLIWKDSSTHIHGLALYVNERLSFARDLSLEKSADSYLCFRLTLLHSVSYFFFLYWSPSSSLCTVFNSILANIDEVLSINPSANVEPCPSTTGRLSHYWLDLNGKLCIMAINKQTKTSLWIRDSNQQLSP